MNQHSRIASSFIIVALYLCFTINNGLANENNTGNNNYVKGKELIDQNCHDCYGATKIGLESGILILESIQGQNNNKELLSYLAKGYRGLALTYYSNGSIEQKKLLEKERYSLKKALKNDAGSIQLQLQYLDRLDEKERYLESNKLVENHKDNAEVHFYLGMQEYYSFNDKTKGLKSLKTAYELVHKNEKKAYGREVLNMLQGDNRKEEYEAFLFSYTKEILEIEIPEIENSLKVSVIIDNKGSGSSFDPFLIQFTNHSNEIIKIPNPTLLKNSFFSFFLINSNGEYVNLSEINFRQLNIKTAGYQQINKRENIIIETNLNKLIPASIKLVNGTYLLYLIYSNKSGDKYTFKGKLFSPPVKIMINN